MKYRHEIAAEAVDALTAEATDTDIANTLAEYFIAHSRAPDARVQFDINHNGKVSPCPVRVDRAGAKKCSVTLAIGDAEAWITEALMRGYEVTGMTMRGLETKSIARTKSTIAHNANMAAYRARRAANPDDDDDIPF